MTNLVLGRKFYVFGRGLLDNTTRGFGYLELVENSAEAALSVGVRYPWPPSVREIGVAETLNVQAVETWTEVNAR